jgi:hypothetical protein
MANKVTNTTEQVKRDPSGFLMDVMAASMSGGHAGDAILNQEARGQRELVASEVLPVQMGPEDRAALEGSGVKFIGVVSGDPIFQHVELPSGWKKVPTDHSMWSELLDDKGRKRARIFYKAAFYDRSAGLHACSRFVIERDYDRGSDVCAYNVTDNGTIVESCAAVDYPENGEDWQARLDADEKARSYAEAWLTERYPNWRDGSAYWD